MQPNEAVMTAGIAMDIFGNPLVTNSSAEILVQDMEKIFDPFHRGKGAKGEGTGLGLAITKKIVALHPGDIAARNASQGFQVSIRLSKFTGQEALI